MRIVFRNRLKLSKLSEFLSSSVSGFQTVGLATCASTFHKWGQRELQGRNMRLIMMIMMETCFEKASFFKVFKTHNNRKSPNFRFKNFLLQFNTLISCLACDFWMLTSHCPLSMTFVMLYWMFFLDHDFVFGLLCSIKLNNHGVYNSWKSWRYPEIILMLLENFYN